MQLKPVLGPVQLTFYSVGVIVGAGVYSVIGSAAGIAGDGLWLAFLVAAVVAALTAFSYAEMTTAFPAAGAEYVYVRKALPRADGAAFGVGVMILLGGAATAATVAVSFGGYLRVFADIPVAVSALALLLACTAFNIWGMRESSGLNIVLTTIEVGGLVLVIAVGLMAESFLPSAASVAQPGIMAAAALLFFVYLGFEEIANMAEEVRNPARDLPRALFASIAITTTLYILVAFAVTALATPQELTASTAPLTTAIHKGWPGAGNLISAIALFSTANTVLITLIATSRLAFSMGRDREIPQIFGRLGRRRETPWVSALLTLAMGAVLVPLGDLKMLAEMSSFAALLGFFAVNLSLILLRYRMPDHPRPFRVSGRIGRMPLLPLAAIGAILLLLVNFEWRIYAAGATAIGFSALAFAVRERFGRRPHSRQEAHRE